MIQHRHSHTEVQAPMGEGAIGGLDSDTAPKVWVLMGHRAGENTQTTALAKALGWSYEIKRLHYRRGVPYFLLDASISGIEPFASSPLTGPWPDLVITAGARNEPVAKWIRKQADKPVRLVHIGRTWAPLDHFDLVVTTPQYRLPQRANVLHNSTTLHQISHTVFEQAGRDWAPRLAHLPGPYIAVVVGGNSGPYTFGRKAARRLARQAGEMAKAAGGSLLVTTSSRTPAHVVATLRDEIDCPMYFHEWRPDAQDNPYFGFLALADSIIVTGDSIAMLSEATATNKPVHIFDLGEGANSMRGATDSMVQVSKQPWRQRLQGWWRARDLDHVRSTIYRWAMRAGIKRLTRDIGIVHQFLVLTGRAVWLGDEFFANVTPLPLNEVPRTVARVQRLLELEGESATREAVQPVYIMEAERDVAYG